MSVRFTMDADKAIKELDRLAQGPGADGTTFKFESILLSAYSATQEQVHVLTGKLKSSGHPTSSFDGHTWEGEVAYVRHPGIFELARGNKPTLNHPEGGHFFLEAMYHTDDAMQHACLDFLRGHEE